ncbi:CHASE2 domain-containing protein [Winogradskyella aquimaris]|uniref:CHASE2 domain-containing protein n=1 Tax=Winogradskyella aquimaris TaxID=864074 RepID=A0ABU5ERI8_9FLAO|nr:CHASE2 domain-containing protein [Winogradskyella aquimaris]MDY2588345.1 CHASE2 domain-containing protein [Winogradskyella aquimaris]
MKTSTKRLLTSAFYSSLVSCIILGILSIAFLNIRFFNPFEKAFQDFSFLDVYFSEQLNEDPSINSEIVLVNIEKHDRTVITSLLNSIIKADPKVIGFDIILKEKKLHDAADSLLARLLKNDKIVTSFEITEQGLIKNDDFFGHNPNESFVNFNFNEENVIRKFLGVKEIDSQIYYSFAAKVVQKYMSQEYWIKQDFNNKLKSEQYINYSGNLEKFPVLSGTDLLFNEQDLFLKDKIVILGYLGVSDMVNDYDIEDKEWTPLNKEITGKSDRDMYGAVVHANIINMLIKNNTIKTISNFWLILFTILSIYLSTVVYLRLYIKYKDTYGVRIQIYQLIFSIVLLLTSFWFLRNNIVLKPILIILGIIVSGSYFEYHDEVFKFLSKKLNIKINHYE